MKEEINKNHIESTEKKKSSGLYSNAEITVEKIRQIRDLYNNKTAKMDIVELVDLPYEIVTTLLTKLRAQGMLLKKKTLKEKIEEAFNQFISEETKS